jgi:hypothetical protein
LIYGEETKKIDFLNGSIWRLGEEKGELSMNISKNATWVDNLSTSDKTKIGISVSFIFFGVIDFLAHIPAIMPIFADFMFVGGGISLFVTSVLLAKKYGVK